MLREKFLGKEAGLIFYSLTPPKANNDKEKLRGIAEKQVERLKHANVDGLILYDIQDESDRTDKERPFAFMSTIKPEVYAREYLQELEVPKVIYKSIANLTEDDFRTWLRGNSDIEYSVFVGASSQQQVLKTNFSLDDAYKVKQEERPGLLLGGVTIPERHASKGDEHSRIFKKADRGCRFFISQCVYSPNNTKDLLSDYYYATLEGERALDPMIFTLAPCGSLKTLYFMEWLGIDVPKWLYNDLKHSKDILGKSVTSCKNIAMEILDYATAKNIPVGFNIESVSIKKEEIEAAGELLEDVIRMVKNR